MELLVFGAGSLGSLLGGLLAREHDVTLVGRDPHMTTVAEQGLRITGIVDEHVHPTAVTEVTGQTADVALVTTKSYDTGRAAAALADAEIASVCSVQNGLGNEELLADALACPVLGGSATYGADLEAPGRVRMTGEGVVAVGTFRGGDATVSELVDAFRSASVTAEATEDVEAMLWTKVAINAAINPVTALARCRNGAVTESPLSAVAEAAAAEAVAVASANGIDLDPEAIHERVFDVASATAENRSSMLQDVLCGRRTEIDAINGAVVTRADDQPVPINRTLRSLVNGLEANNIDS